MHSSSCPHHDIPNVKNLPESTNDDNFGNLVIGSLLCHVVHYRLRVRKGRPFWPIWYPTFYKVGNFGRVAKKPLAPQHKTQTHKHTTTNIMNRRHPNQQLHPLPPWVGQWWHQIMVPPLPIGLWKARVVGLGGAAVGSLVWGANASPITKLKEGRSWP